MAEIKKKKISKSSLKEAVQLYRFIKPYRIEFYLGMVALVGSSVTTLMFPKLLGDLVSAGSSGLLAEKINSIALLLGVLLLFQSFFSYFRTFLFVRVTEKTLADLRQFTYNHLIKLPLFFFEKRRVGELNSRISADVSLLQETLTTTLAEVVRQLIIIIGGIAYMLYVFPKLTLFMLAIIPAVVVLAVVFGRFIRRYSKKAQAEVAESNTIVEETLQGIQSVKSYTNEFFEMARYKNKVQEIAKIGIKGGVYRGAFGSFLVFGLFGSLVAVVWRAASLLSSGEMDSGNLISFVMYSGIIGGTIGGMASVFTRIQHFLGAIEDLFDISREKEEDLKEVVELPANDVLKGTIEIKNLSFAYPSRPDTNVLNDINLKVERDQMVAFVGASGAGKTTITALLYRLHELSKGQILFDDRPSSEMELSILRYQMALVPQDIFLFGGTIRENIAYGRSSANEEEIISAAQSANAMEFIEGFEEGLDTIVGERGTQLSGGQRQRIAIARALLRNPRILILDEATSALDSNSEKLVQEALKTLMKGRTTIVIAHRLSTIKSADQIFVMDKGTIVEQGKHEELLSMESGYYKKLSTLQGIEQNLI
ncbi:ABC transporter ATP-binding protein [Carboxylicivirga sp. N1Y90]|uniref:ABC transporter ATP-binding protein n=1 Tax=Carboxylicivirga fragile TaxID=3417571 RepID=UPI003D32CB57|nr:ATP-binding cassette domain-containing protein [Marinilabiliaceae bacterium N1Y90]